MPPGRSEAKIVHRWAGLARFPWWIGTLLKIALGKGFCDEICSWALGSPKRARMGRFGWVSMVDLHVRFLTVCRGKQLQISSF